MATRLRITCVSKTNRSDPHDRIHSVGGTNPSGAAFRHSQQQAIVNIRSGAYEYYVHVGQLMVDVIVSTHNGNPYIKTKNDGLHPDNLLSLPECP